PWLVRKVAAHGVGNDGLVPGLAVVARAGDRDAAAVDPALVDDAVQVMPDNRIAVARLAGDVDATPAGPALSSVVGCPKAAIARARAIVVVAAGDHLLCIQRIDGDRRLINGFGSAG